MWIWFCFVLLVTGQGEFDQECYDNCNCCKNNKCQSIDIYGWNNYCTEGCIDRHRGARCYVLCTYNCVSCVQNVNICTECFEGFHLGPNSDCTSECPTNCRTCTSDTICTACKDGYYNKDGSKTCPYSHCPANCMCSGNTCAACRNGFYDTANECIKECPSNCMSCSSRELCTECKHGFYNGYQFDTTVKHLLNNCTFRCRDSCLECQSYDNCLQCIKGKYGQKCQINCSVGCKDQTCDIESGYCSCSSHFGGDRCTDCISGKFGIYCNEICPEYCKNGKCNKTSGFCSDGCITDLITGAKCNVCIHGMQGIFCNETCPTNCRGRTCNRTTGFCSEGCEDNFKGVNCDTCIQGKYGTACKHDCPKLCENALCEKETGSCVRCTGNFDGDNCTYCQPGFRGQNCMNKCSSRCYNTTCGINTGVRDYGCTENYSGDMCCVPSGKCVKCASKTECKECKSGYFGHLCDRTCSENCNAHSGDTRHCASSDGKCSFGCKDGFYGIMCNSICSDLCVGNICKQDSGICEKGCGSSNDDPVCVLDLECRDKDNFGISGKLMTNFDKWKPEVPSGDNSTATTKIIVLATLLALTTSALCILILWIIVSKIRSADRQTENSSCQIPLEHSLVANQAPQNGSSEADSSAYEILDGTQGAPEHTYDTASASAPKSMDNHGNTDYMNLQIKKSRNANNRT